jgi:flagellar biosynthesis protein
VSDSPDGRPREAPRRVAVALKHERPELPKIVATGRGALADRILDIAFASGVAVREDAELAQVLAAVELDCPIPIAAFEAVAEILAYLYRLNGTFVPPATP